MNSELQIHEERNYLIVKANEIIQKARYDLSVSELKLISFIFSKVKPTDKEFCRYEFSINDYCRILGIEENNGMNYKYIKQTAEQIENKGFWLTLEDGKETFVRWINKTWINPGSGKIEVRLDEDIQRFIIGLISDYTQYSLLYVLPMKSSYSMRVYELLKSYAYQKTYTFDTDQLKRQLGVSEHYKNFKDFRKCVLEVATKEINLYTDLEVSWEPITKGRKVIQVKFYIRVRDRNGKLLSALNAQEALDG